MLNSPKQQNGSVFIVDDVASNIYVTKTLLETYGLQVESAASGIEAVNIIKAGNVFDILLMDHLMPEMDGIQAAKIIRETGYKNCIIAFTANTAPEQTDIYLKNGFDAHITKPIDPAKLEPLLNKYIFCKNFNNTSETVEPEQNKNTLRTTPPNNSLPDTAKTIAVMEETHAKLGSLTYEDIKLFIAAVHDIKTVLSHSGFTDLADKALKLETAIKEHNKSYLKEEIPAFLNALRFDSP